MAFPEITAQSSPELEPSAKQTRFNDNRAQAQRLAGFSDREFFDMAENEHYPQPWLQRAQALNHNLLELRRPIEFLWIGGPVSQVPRENVAVTWKITVERLFPGGPLFAQLHQSFVQHDANHPGGELCAAMKLIQFLIGLEESFLNRVFGLLAVMRDTLCNSQQLAVVPSYNLVEGCNAASLRRVNESQVILRFTRSLAMRGSFGHASVHTPPMVRH
jgi:hypothetical protein